MTVTDAQFKDLMNKFKLLEQQQGLLTQFDRQMLEGRLKGADGAAGTLVALEGGQTSVDVAPFVFDE